MVNFRKLVAVDMVVNGTRFILAEVALGVVIPLILGVLSLLSDLLGGNQPGRDTVLGIWLVGIAVNYVPLLIYAVLIARGGTVKEEGGPEVVRAKRYTIQQVIILVPFVVAVLAVIQEISQRQQAK
jgi:hypothetical protein